MNVTLKQLEDLKAALRPECLWRGCKERGLYFSRRTMYNGRVYEGLWCAAHEEIVGDENMKRWLKGG